MMNKLCSIWYRAGKIVSFMTAILIISGCDMGKLALKSDLYGNYIANYSIAKERLTLLSNGKFIQKVTLKATGKTYIARGVWKYDLKQYSDSVLLSNNFMNVLNENALNKNFDKTPSYDTWTWLQIYNYPPEPLRLGSYEYDGQYIKVASTTMKKKKANKVR